MRKKIPEKNFAFHNAKFVKILDRNTFFVENVREYGAGLLGIGFTERLIKRLDELL